jgi:hypothetical protein
MGHLKKGKLRRLRTAELGSGRPERAEAAFGRSLIRVPWKSKETAHSPPAKDPPSGLPAPCVLTRFSKRRFRHARVVPV